MLRRALRQCSPRVPLVAPPHGGGPGRILNANHFLDPNSTAYQMKMTHCRGIINLNERQSCDVELLSNGTFNPLQGFMNPDDYKSCLDDLRIRNYGNVLWSLPVVLDTNGIQKPGETWLLRYDGKDLAFLDVESVWKPFKEDECKKCYGSTSIEHPGVRMVAMERKGYYVGGKVHPLAYPKRYYQVKTPHDIRQENPYGASITAFQCRNPIHRAHFELFMRVLQNRDGIVLVHPTCGPTQEDDIPGDTRVDTYEALRKDIEEKRTPYPELSHRVFWAYLPYSMHMAGPREAIQHMIMRKNYGCSEFIIGRDMAGCKSSLTGVDFYGPYEAQDFAAKYADELGMRILPSPNIVYTKEKGFVSEHEAESQKLKVEKLSGTEFRRRLRTGEPLPDWFSFPSVIEVLRKSVE